MEYRDIRYTVRARIQRDEWSVSIHPADIESPRKVVTGREEAELLARSMIDRWHETRGAERSESEPAQRTYVSKHGTVATMNIAALNKHKRDFGLALGIASAARTTQRCRGCVLERTLRSLPGSIRGHAATD